MRDVALKLLGRILLATVLLTVAFNAWVTSTDLPSLTIPLSREVHAEDGHLLRVLTTPEGRWRLSVELEDVDPKYVEALIAYEDRRFWTHRGVDVRAVTRAAWQAVGNRGIVSGASTLTMQVARLLEGTGTGSWAGKIRQVRVALALERTLSKEQILGLYLHLAPMGGNLEGVRAGSLAWFGREPGRLHPEQVAMLIALPQSPVARNPGVDPQAATEARDRVLRRLEQVGVYLEEDVHAALAQGVPAERRAFPAHAAHLADRLVAADPSRVQHATAVRWDLQVQLEALARDALRGQPESVTVAMMVAEVSTGAILASVGSAEYGSAMRDGYAGGLVDHVF